MKLRNSMSMKSGDSSSRDPRVKAKALKKIAPRVLKLAYPHRSTLFVGLVALVLGSGINLLFPNLIKRFINGELPLSVTKDLPLITLLLIGLFALQSVFFYIRHYCFTIVGYRVVSDLRIALYRAIVEQDIAFFDTSRTGDLLSRLSSDTQDVQRAMTVNISVALRYLVQVIGGIILMLYISLRLTLVILFVVPAIVFISILWGKKLRRHSRQLQDQLGEANVIAEETVTAIRTVRVYARDNYEVNRYRHAIQRSLATGETRTQVAAQFSSFMVFFMNSCIALVLWYGLTLIFQNRLSIGELTEFLLYCVLAAVSFGFLTNVWDEFMQAVGASERIFEIIDSKPKILPPSSPKPLQTDLRAGSVSFENVRFSYPSRPEAEVLKNISFEIQEGMTVALVGASGSGKSTIASLIPRFYDPSSGVIRYCKTALPDLDPKALREQISFVSQDPQVFYVSIGENIRYGRLEATEQEITQAAVAANIHSFIESLPEKYNTLVGDRGVQLSGGQRQRIAISRALLKNPKFLILDEATSALDSQNEQLIQQALSHLMKGRTSLVIAHRLSTVQHANLVLVVKDGEICQRGIHEELMKQPGLYKTLVELQLL